MNYLTHFVKACLVMGFFLFACLVVSAQDVKYGKIDPEELKMTTYAADSSAEAVVLYERGRSYFIYNRDQGFRLKHEYHVRIKILKKSGLKWADQTIPLYRSGAANDPRKEEIQELKAATYVWENGKEIKYKLENKAVFDEEVSKYKRHKKFSMPNVKEGAIIEITYDKVSDFWVNFQDWRFQRSIPVKWSEYTARIPSYFTFHVKEQGYEKYEVNETTHCSDLFIHEPLAGKPGSQPTRWTPVSTCYRWVMKQVSAFQEEDYITTQEDYISKVEFQLESYEFPWQQARTYFSEDWKKINERLLADEDFGRVANRKVMKEIPALQLAVASKNNPEEKMTAIYNYLRTNISWSGRYGIYSNTGVKEVVERKSGSVSEINLLLTALLREADIEANPVVLSTRQNGKVRIWFPSTGQFDYVIVHVKIGDNYYLLDATDAERPIGLLPLRCLNETGWKVAASTAGWIQINNTLKTSQTFLTQLTVDTEGKLSGTIQCRQEGYQALYARRDIASLGEAEYFKKDFKTESSGFTLVKTTVENAQVANLPLNSTCEIMAPEYAQVAGDRIYINPMLPQLIRENPFKNKTRKYPVDFTFPLQENYMLTLTIPDGYEVESVPKNMSIGLAGESMLFTYVTVLTGNKIQLTMKLSINQPVVSSAEYTALQEFFAQLTAQEAEQIVLKKK